MLSVLPAPTDLLDTVFAALAAHKLPTHLPCDHICYRVATQARYAELKERLQAIGSLESEALIYGRPICTFKLQTPYVYGAHSIPALELPAPKDGSPYPEGWEHAEFATGEPLPQFIARFPHVAFGTGAMNKPHNPEVSLKVGSGYAIKFHPEPLLEVVRKERLMGIG
jgi:uncharacterized protein